MTDLTMGQRIAECRKKKGLSQEVLGEKVGVSRQAISKWESDGAVPEIDKLIALSKLFGVSVGWLLGVEDQPEPPADELTDTQLKMVEEIVKRYQPEPMEKKFPWIASALLLGAGLLIAISLFFNVSGTSTDYSSQISALQSNYAQIQGQLSSLDNRLDDLAAAAEAADKLLLSYEMELTACTPGSGESENIITGPNTSTIIVDLPTVTLQFSAILRQYTEGDTAYLSVLLDGTEWERVECQWQGAGCSAEVTVPHVDGCKFCFILAKSDGTQQFQTLDGGYFESLATSTEIQCEVSTPPVLGWRAEALQVRELCGDASMPALSVGSDEPCWEDISFILYVDGIEIDRYPLLDESASDPHQRYYTSTVISAGSSVHSRISRALQP